MADQDRILQRLGVGSVRAPIADWRQTGPWIQFGNRTCIALVLALMVGSVFLSVSGAVVAGGTINVEHNYKIVQHLDGGIVAKINVRNGERVKEGDVLLRLDDTAARANLAIVVGRINDLLVQQARLEAERDRAEQIDLPDAIKANARDPELGRIIDSQRALFVARRMARLGERQVLTERVGQIEAEVGSLEMQLKARTREAAINQEELKALEPLRQSGLTTLQRVLPVQRESARLEGDIGRIKGDMAKARGSVAEAQLKVAQADKEYTQQIVDELRKVQASLAEQSEQRATLQDKLARIDIRAPRTGRVHALAIHTEGGVVTPATPILQIVPEGGRLVVEAQISPQDVDKVRKGLPCSVRFPAFNARITPKLEGVVQNISAAQLSDQQGKSYFMVQVEIAPGETDKLGAGHQLLPGMPAEVFIETGSRSIMSYFVKPLTDAMARAFRES